MTGTSLDGITAALVDIEDRDSPGTPLEVKVRAHRTYPFPKGLREEIERVAEGDGSPREICCLHAYLGEELARAVSRFLGETGARAEEIGLIGTHGQTVAHLPRGLAGYRFSTPSTLQLGDPGVIAARIGITTVGDFRPPDLALGGEGAPLIPYVDWLLFRHPERARVLLNIGGIANVTHIPRDATPDLVWASDVGPGNMAIDGAMRRLTGGKFRYDPDGTWAARGKVAASFLDELLEHPFFTRPFPKSTGREEFGAEFVSWALARARELGLAPEDAVATLTALTVEGVRRALASLELVDEVIASGGGVRNRTLMTWLEGVCAEKGARLTTSDAYGIPAEAKEAVGFAVLAYQAFHRRVNHLPQTTGAKRPLILGKICPGWPERMG